jgi:hypothetical protein
MSRVLPQPCSHRSLAEHFAAPSREPLDRRADLLADVDAAMMLSSIGRPMGSFPDQPGVHLK